MVSSTSSDVVLLVVGAAWVIVVSSAVFLSVFPSDVVLLIVDAAGTVVVSSTVFLSVSPSDVMLLVGVLCVVDAAWVVAVLSTRFVVGGTSALEPLAAEGVVIALDVIDEVDGAVVEVVVDGVVADVVVSGVAAVVGVAVVADNDDVVVVELVLEVVGLLERPGESSSAEVAEGPCCPDPLPSCASLSESSPDGRLVVRTCVFFLPSGRSEVVVVRLVRIDSNGVVVVVCSVVADVVSGMMGMETLVTIRFICRGK